jgi:ribosomal protein S4
MTKQSEIGAEAYKYLISTMENRPRISDLAKDLYAKRWKNQDYGQKSLMKEFINALKRNHVENAVLFVENVVDMLVMSFALGDLSRENSVMLGFITKANEDSFRSY